MSVTVERHTVSLWPMNQSPVSSAPRPPRPATEVLAAITSSYRHGRAGIISGVPSPGARRPGDDPPADLAPSTHFPTVPLTLLSSPTPAEVTEVPPADQGREVGTLWSRLVRTRRPAPRGRHSPKC